MIARTVSFVLIFGALQSMWLAFGESPLQRSIIERGVVGPAAAIARAVTPNIGVYSIGSRLRTSGAGINIVNGCDGTETLFLLVAAFAVAPMPPRVRLSGILIGIPLVYLLNLLRILTLFYARQAGIDVFEVVHGVVTPVFMILCVVAYFYACLRRSPRMAAA